jgi:hypothetical protein
MKIEVKKDHVVLSNKDGSYHLSLDRYRELGKDEVVKIAKSEIKKKISSGIYPYETIDFSQARELGFCEYGIIDFCNALGLDTGKTYSIEKLNKLLTMEIILEYPDEILQIFGKDCIKYLGEARNLINKKNIDLFLREEFILEKNLHLLSVEFAKSCLCIFEEKYPNDDRPRKAIEAKEKWIKGKISTSQLDAASKAANSSRSVAWAAISSARSAAWAATSSASNAARAAFWAARAAFWAAGSAWAASWAASEAEKEKQVEMVKRYL